jgi:hypothetical protein
MPNVKVQRSNEIQTLNIKTLTKNILKIPLTPSLSPAFAEAASRRQAGGERGRVRGGMIWNLSFEF